MKRLLMVVFTIVLSVSLAACGDPEDKKVKNNDDGGDPISSEIDRPETDTDDLSQSDPGQTNDLEWWGVWMGDGFSIEITEYDGKSFWFEIMNLGNGSMMMAGNATLYPGNDYMAEYGELSFSLYDDYSAVDIFLPESSEWSYLRGQYKMLDQDNPYNLDLDTDGINPHGSDPGDTNGSTQSDPGDTNNSNQSDPGDTTGPQWAGPYTDDGFTIEITEFDGQNFWFEIVNLGNGNMVLAGNATLYPDNAYMAEYGEISFYLYDDYSGIDFFVAESSQWAYLRGHYRS